MGPFNSCSERYRVLVCASSCPDHAVARAGRRSPPCRRAASSSVRCSNCSAIAFAVLQRRRRRKTRRGAPPCGPLSNDMGSWIDCLGRTVDSLDPADQGCRGALASALSASYLLAAKQYIQDHLDDPLLSCDRVAAAAGISSRHLTRLLLRRAVPPAATCRTNASSAPASC